jgi:hypothetical protein
MTLEQYNSINSLLRDAARYRWIAAQAYCPFSEADMTWDSKEKLDAAIDACLAQEAKCSAS